MPDTDTKGLGHLGHYKKYIEFFDRASIVLSGYMYAYYYMFQRKGVPQEKLRFYDWWPLTFVFQVDFKERRFYGLNFHHLPVRTRLIWLARIKRLYAAKFPTDEIKRNFLTPKRIPMTYKRLVLILIKSKYGIRQYRMDRVRKLRIVPNTQWEQAMRYFSKTYYRVTYEQKVNDYNRYNPYRKIKHPRPAARGSKLKA
jgi:hypothetical protein